MIEESLKLKKCVEEKNGQGRFFLFFKIKVTKACLYAAKSNILQRKTTDEVGKRGNNSKHSKDVEKVKRSSAFWSAIGDPVALTLLLIIFPRIC